MTDPEKRALSERLARLAEAAGLPTELVYLQYWECSDGHINPVKFEPMYCFQALPHTVNNTVSCRKAVYPVMIPRDLTDPAVLLPLVEAYFEHPHAAIDWEWYRVKEGWLVYFIDAVRNEDRQWNGVGATIPEAIAQALCAAMESEKGEPA